MASCLEANELNEMRKKAEEMAKLVSAVVIFPYHFIRFIFYSYWLLIKLHYYFKAVSMERLTKCCKPEKQICVDCLTKIYQFEQEMLNDFRECTNLRIIGREFQKAVDKLENRSENLVLSANNETIETINSYINKIEKGEIGKSDWHEQLNAL
jgi:hypothetical protein